MNGEEKKENVWYNSNVVIYSMVCQSVSKSSSQNNCNKKLELKYKLKKYNKSANYKIDISI